MTAHGFCISEQADVLIDAGRRCLNDQTLCIPPTWGNHLQRWEDGQWHPEIARPEGHERRPMPKAAVKFQPTESKAPARFRHQRKPRTPAPKPQSQRGQLAVCADCGAEFLSLLGIRYCSDDCRHQARLASRRRHAALKRALRIACRGCGRNDKPEKNRGLCENCWRAERSRAAALGVAS